MDLEKISQHLKKEDFYFSNIKSEISYPEEGYNYCYQIEEDSFWFKHRNRIITEGVTKYSPNSTFFDIGGGNGFVSKALQEVGITTVLVEPGLQGCKNAKKRKIKNIICAALEDVGFEQNSLGSVGLFDVVEHIKDDHKFLSNIQNLMKKGEHIYITVPAYNSLWSGEDVIAGHYRRYSLSQIENLLENCGFKIQYSSYIFSILPLPVLLVRTIPHKLGFRKDVSNFEKYQKEHRNKHGILNPILQKIWNWEVKAVRASKKIKFGGSCFIIAKKEK